MAKVGETWWREYLPIHFSTRARRRYNYRPRDGESGSGRPFKGSYAELKVNRGEVAGAVAIGENKPLVFTGRSRERATGQKNIRAVAKSFQEYRAEVVIHTPALNFVDGARQELLASTPQEESELERVFAEQWEAELLKLGRKSRSTKNFAA